MTRPSRAKKEKKSKLELEYEKHFYPFTQIKEPQTSLAQPHVRKIVSSVVTYAAYEEPI